MSLLVLSFVACCVAVAVAVVIVVSVVATVAAARDDVSSVSSVLIEVVPVEAFKAGDVDVDFADVDGNSGDGRSAEDEDEDDDEEEDMVDDAVRNSTTGSR